MKPRRDIDPDLLDWWATVRSKANEAFEAAVEGGPNPDGDLMGAIAYRSQFPEPKPFDPVLARWVHRAFHEERRSWREISAAIGDHNEESVQSRFHYRERQLGLRTAGTDTP